MTWVERLGSAHAAIEVGRRAQTYACLFGAAVAALSRAQRAAWLTRLGQPTTKRASEHVARALGTDDPRCLMWATYYLLYDECHRGPEPPASDLEAEILTRRLEAARERERLAMLELARLVDAVVVP